MANGIDYGMGRTNVDHATGIRYGVISMHEVTQAWCDISEPNYGDPHCPKCGNEVGESQSHFAYSAECGVYHCEECDQCFYPMELNNEDGDVDACPECCNGKTLEKSSYETSGCGEYVCHHCCETFEADYAFGEPLAHTLSDGEYKATQDSYGDIFILESPYYTLCEYCSPCAPGAGYLMNEGSVKAYCFGHDWFEDGKAPYAVYSVATGEPVTA